MEKTKKWQLAVIAAVVLLTLYNILPTLFYYAKPLSEPISEERAQAVAHQIETRVDGLEEDGQSWLASFSRLIGVSPSSIEIDPNDAGNYLVSFSNSRDAERFSRLLPRAGSYIGFVPAQLLLVDGTNADKVVVRRRISLHLGGEKWFDYVPLQSKEGNLNPTFVSWIEDRASAVIEALGGMPPIAQEIEAWMDKKEENLDAFALNLSRDLVDLERTLGKGTPLLNKFLSRLAFGEASERGEKVKSLAARLEMLSKDETINVENRQELAKASELLKRNQNLFTTRLQPIDISTKGKKQIALGSVNPFFSDLQIDWEKGLMSLNLQKDIKKSLSSPGSGERGAMVQERLRTLLVQEIALVNRTTGEKVEENEGDDFTIAFSPLSETTSFLALDMEKVGQALSNQLETALKTEWVPEHPDLIHANYPIVRGQQILGLKEKDRELALVILEPLANDPMTKGLNKSSLYVIARGAKKLLDSAELQSKEAQEIWKKDFESLQKLMAVRGYVLYPGNIPGMPHGFEEDFIFENPTFANYLLGATRENFEILGSKRFAMLPFSTVRERISRENAIEDGIQEDLLKWKEEYQTAQVNLDPLQRLTVPEPTKSPYFENLKLSMRKYVRGDDKRVLKWGLDLSGGKAVRVGLVDHAGMPVTDPDDLRQAVDELFTRINKLGVSEQTIRIEDSHILVEFPGSQHLSAEELIQASSMTFHIANEKFGPENPALRETVDAFLQEVWNEAVVTQKTDIGSIRDIAWKKMGGDLSQEETPLPRGPIAELLFQEGLRLAPATGMPVSSSFDDTLSTIGRFRGKDRTEWGHAHPLMIYFHNYVLEGSSLDNVNVGYDSREGNYLTFGVKGSYDGGRAGNPRDELHAWTTHFSEESLVGTPFEKWSDGKPWRMAVVLNEEIVTAPHLKAPLKDSGSITGRFTQREINRLAADLKAGSLTFTPKILSETNISPELGKEERAAGFGAAIIALAGVVVTMVAYYRFAGVVASIAVLFNLLILWGVLQNIDAALTLPGIAGIVLTIGMAVDANVLVFERIKEEFRNSGRISSAIQAGYNKAYSAIVDSNLTTLIAAVILTQFDSGPIKGFAINLIIGVASSMFTALFMTRVFFTWWVERGGKKLNMSHMFGGTNYPFLSKSKLCVAISLILIAVGAVVFVQQRQTLFGMDFTGGYSLIADVEGAPNSTPRLLVKEVLVEAGALPNEVDVRELSRPTQLRIQLGKGMDEAGRPFHGFTAARTENPRLEWVIAALQKGGVALKTTNVATLDASWSEMSGQFSQAMQRNAIFAILLALVAILVYITLRFEWKYAVASVIGLVHDLLVTLALVALFHAFGFTIEIDLVAVGALMTIIGYSLNNTIIVFDRVREDLKLLRKHSFYDIITHALNETLSRTILTSGTTLLVLLSLVFFGGSALFGFSLVMTLGVFFGTLSSLFVAPYILYHLAMREGEEKVETTPTSRLKSLA